MKFTICTIVDSNPNYGNKLQNVAIQRLLEQYGHEVWTISYTPFKATLKEKFKCGLQKITGYRLPGDKIYWKYDYYRKMEFFKFNKKFMNLYFIKNIQDIKDSDYFIVGSDQVWNSKWYNSNIIKKDLFLLTFCEDKKKICFSPSFGIEEVPDEWKPWFKKNISPIPHLSVREEAGARIIKELTGRDAEVLIDPTLMLDASEWNEIAKQPKKIDCDKKYILTYFLGSRSNRVNEELKKYEKQGYTIYNLLDYAQPDVYVSGPSEFIYLFSHASLILTDSFHACVFSFIYEKPFLVYAREGKENNMMSRMDTLLSKFDLKRKYVDSGLTNTVFEHDYSVGKEVLKKEREKVKKYLETAIG